MKRLRKFLSLSPRDRYLLSSTVFSYCSLWLWWVLANVASGLLRQFSELFWLTGPVVGVFQWLVLRRYIRHIGWWVLASAGGWIIAFMITYVFKGGTKISAMAPKVELTVGGAPVNMQVFWSYVLVSFLASAVIGVFQWLVMRRHIQHSGWWVLASSMGGVVRGAAIAVIKSVAGIVLGNVAGWFGYGAVTGIALVWLLQDRIKHRLEREMYLGSIF